MGETPLCMCGNTMKKEINTFTHIIFKKQITLHNVPHYFCATCGNSQYDSEETVVRLLREAYINEHGQTYYQ